MQRDQSRDKYIYIKFIIIFSISFSMIIWTITETAKAGVGLDDDNAFLSNYQNVNENFNDIIRQNNEFEALYNIKLIFNGHEIVGLTYEDIFLAQRVIQEREARKNMLKTGQNDLKVLIQDKQGNEIKNKNIEVLFTKAVSIDFDEKINMKNEDSKNFTVANMGYWNITGTVEVDGKKGFFYIKTNAK